MSVGSFCASTDILFKFNVCNDDDVLVRLVVWVPIG